MSTSRGVKRRGQKGRKMVAYYECSVCRYTSERYYNVTRHEFRIHSASSKKRRCCDVSFSTKGEYYLHCQEYHPFATTVTSRTKYKIKDTKQNDDTSDYPVSQDSETNIDVNDEIMNFENRNDDNDEIMNFENRNDDDDETMKKCVSHNIAESASHDLPIKKRILRNITLNERRNHMELGKSIVDRLYRRIRNDSGFTMKGRKKCRLGRRMKEKNMDSSDTENHSPVSSINGKQRIQKRDNEANVEVRVDPRISWHDFTQVHREFMTTFFEIV